MPEEDPSQPSEIIDDNFSLDARKVSPGVCCIECKYLLENLPVAGKCPECSLPIKQSLLGRGIHCIECNYIIDNLPTSGKCPECSRSIEQSIQGNLLQFTTLPYLRRVYLGYQLHYFGIVAFLVTVGLIVCILNAVATIDNLDALYIGLFCSILLTFVGSCLITTPDPLYRDKKKPLGYLYYTRTVSVMYIILLLIHAFFWMFEAYQVINFTLTLTLVTFLSFLTLFIFPICVCFISTWYTSRCALRTYEARVRTLSSTVLITVVGSIVLIVFNFFVLSQVIPAALPTFVVVNAFTILIAIIAYILLVHDTTMFFRREVKFMKSRPVNSTITD